MSKAEYRKQNIESRMSKVDYRKQTSLKDWIILSSTKFRKLELEKFKEGSDWT